jgi:hypothetical protein
MWGNEIYPTVWLPCFQYLLACFVDVHGQSAADRVGVQSLAQAVAAEEVAHALHRRRQHLGTDNNA